RSRADQGRRGDEVGNVKTVQVRNRRTQRVLGGRVDVADRWWLRLRGLLGRPAPGQGQGLLIQPCRAVHMLGMKYPLDIAFIDRLGLVTALYPALQPGQRSAWHKDAYSALELPAGVLLLTDTAVGDMLDVTASL